MNLKYMTGPVLKATAGGFDAVITTPRIDSDGESVDPLGLVNKAEYMTNPLVYWSHEWAFDHAAEPIGKATRIDQFGDRIESSALFAPTQKAQNIRALVQGGFVSRTSIGFDPLDMQDIKGIPTHTQWALREYSVVPMPANTEATITGVKSALRWFADEIAEPEAEGNVYTVKLDASDLMAALDTLKLTVDDGAVVVNDGPRRLLTIRRRRRVLTLH